MEIIIIIISSKHTDRVDPEECSRTENVGSESRVPPPSKDEPKHDTLIRSLTRSDNVSSLQPPPPSLDRKQPRKKKVLGPPTFNYKKLSNVYSQIRTNYPQVPDESPVDAKRKPGV